MEYRGGRQDTSYLDYVTRRENIRHYYGDIVRQLFVAVAALMLIAAPLYADSVRGQMPFIAAAALFMVGLAAFTSPHNKTVMMLNVVVSGAAIVLYEAWALLGYQDGAPIAFVLREAVVVVLLGAFYFSTKTWRAMLTDQIGREHGAGEFGDVPDETPQKTFSIDGVGAPEEIIVQPLQDKRRPLDALGRPAARLRDKLFKW